MLINADLQGAVACGTTYFNHAELSGARLGGAKFPGINAVEAVFDEDEVPAYWTGYIKKNYEFFGREYKG